MAVKLGDIRSIRNFRLQETGAAPHTESFKSLPIPSISITIRSVEWRFAVYFLDRSICTSPRSPDRRWACNWVDPDPYAGRRFIYEEGRSASVSMVLTEPCFQLDRSPNNYPSSTFSLIVASSFDKHVIIGRAIVCTVYNV